MPLEASAAIPPTSGALRITSTEGLAPDQPPSAPPSQPDPEPEPKPERRTHPMPEPSTNGRTTERGGIDALIAEAEQMRMLLADASARLSRLLTSLKQHRRHAGRAGGRVLAAADEPGQVSGPGCAVQEAPCRLLGQAAGLN
jgi:hypothetical protein